MLPLQGPLGGRVTLPQAAGGAGESLCKSDAQMATLRSYLGMTQAT